jgi:non-lysosomal glucosylceramidase
MARSFGEGSSVSKYHSMFSKAKSSYVTEAWNGEYFRYDTQSEYGDGIQADQLAGEWYGDMTDLGDSVSRL